MNRLCKRLLAICAAVVCASAQGQVGYGYYPPFGLPVVAETASYTSTIYLHNPGPYIQNVKWTFQGATSSATPGTTQCPPLELQPGVVLKTSLSAVCPLNPGANFGALTITDNLIYQGIAMYSRIETPSGNGFSVEGTIATTCCNYVAQVIGLKRQAAAPTYQSNCFVHNEEPRIGRVVVTLATGIGGLVASTLIDLQPNEVIRLLDVFDSLNAPAGDYDNISATFEAIVPVAGGQPVNFSAACTVQNSTSFDADFRIAKGHF